MSRALTIIFILVAVLFSGKGNYSWGQMGPADRQKAMDLYRQGMKFVEEKKFEEAATLLNRARKTDPGNFEIPVKYAQVLFKLKQYEKSANAVKHIIQTKNASAECYQVFGNSMDMLGKTQYAIEIYKEGIKKFPTSGFLYLEMGIVEYARENDSIALCHWEEGIRSDPDYASNYYWAAKICHDKEEWTWEFIYGGIFLDLERNSSRSAEISRMLFDIFENSYYMAFDSSMAFEIDGNFRPYSKQSPIAEDPGKRFEQAVEFIFNQSLYGKDPVFGIPTLAECLQNFWVEWQREDLDKEFPNGYFHWLKEISENQFSLPYFYFLFYEASPSGFREWYRENENLFLSFQEWHTSHSVASWLHSPVFRGMYFEKNKN